MPANVIRPQHQQLAEIGCPSEWVLQELGLDVERCRCDGFVVDLDEQGGALGEPAAVERGQSCECGFVAGSAEADQTGELRCRPPWSGASIEPMAEMAASNYASWKGTSSPSPP